MNNKDIWAPTMGDTVYLDSHVKKAIYWTDWLNVDSTKGTFDCLIHNNFEGYGISQNEGNKNILLGMKSSMLVDPEMYVRLQSCKMVLIEKNIQKRIIHYGY